VSQQLQLRAIRATLAALVAQVDALVARADEDVRVAQLAEPAPECAHPERDRDFFKVATFGEPGRWMCRRCGVIGGEKAAAEEQTHGG
jgi:hypothetical protein